MSLFTINKYELDEECANHPSNYYEYAKQLADANKVVEQAKVELDLIEAELDLEIRRKPDKFKIKKITEAIIKQTVLVQQERIDAVNDWIKAKHEAEVLRATVNGLEHKKRMLSDLVQLQGQEYFAEPSVPKKYREGHDELSRKKNRKAMEVKKHKRREHD